MTAVDLWPTAPSFGSGQAAREHANPSQGGTVTISWEQGPDGSWYPVEHRDLGPNDN